MLTTPDNIWTPDSTDDYDLTIDWAATADDIQAALTKRANYGVGTTTQRNAALTLMPNGAQWYDTTLSYEYRKVSGAWVINSTGWISWATVPTGITVGNGTLTQQYKIANGIAEVRGTFLLGSTSSISGSVLVTNPVSAAEGYNANLGSATFQTAAFARYPGAVTSEGAQSLLTCIDNSSTYARLTGLSGSVPFSWNAGCRMVWNYSFIVA